MKHLNMTALLLALLLLLTACGGGAPAPTQAPEATEAPFDPAAFLQEIAPIADCLRSCDEEVFGAQLEPNRVFYAGYAYGENGEEVLWLYPENAPLPEGCWEDPMMAMYYPVTNFSTNAQVRAQLEQFMTPALVSEKFHDDFLEYDGSLYLVRGGRGYGALVCNPETLRYVGEENGNQVVSIDYELFGSFDHTATLVLCPEGSGWKLTDIRE